MQRETWTREVIGEKVEFDRDSDNKVVERVTLKIERSLLLLFGRENGRRPDQRCGTMMLARPAVAHSLCGAALFSVRLRCRLDVGAVGEEEKEKGTRQKGKRSFVREKTHSNDRENKRLVF